MWTWIHSDHLHSATVVTDINGVEVRRLAYAAFGEEVENSGSGLEPKYTYTAKEADQSGLMYYGARYYDLVLARFITADTMYDQGPQGLNRYSYALNNPILYRDPTGHYVDADIDGTDQVRGALVAVQLAQVLGYDGMWRVDVCHWSEGRGGCAKDSQGARVSTRMQILHRCPNRMLPS